MDKEDGWRKAVEKDGHPWVHIFDKGHRHYNGTYGNGMIMMVDREGNIALTKPSYADIVTYLENDKKS